VSHPLFISCYTPDYETRAKSLMRSLRRCKLDFEVEPIAELGSWQKNSQFKSKFIWKKLTEHFDRNLGIGQPIVWIDADAEILSYPVEFDHLESDIGVCEFKHTGRDLTEMLSGTIYFKNNLMSHRVVDKWIETCGENPEKWDQKCLRIAVDHFATQGLRVTFLPITYCFIHDTHKEMFPEAEPVIVHFQESRQARIRKPYM
jgi:Nucleotide-diphospho-sugar transferase